MDSVVIRSRVRKRRGVRFQGKPLLWRQGVANGEILPNLSRKVYLSYHHLFLNQRPRFVRGLFYLIGICMDLTLADADDEHRYSYEGTGERIN